jgi:hypothetical protein
VREAVLVVAEPEAHEEAVRALLLRGDDVERVGREPDALLAVGERQRQSVALRRRHDGGGPFGTRAGGTPRRMSTTSADERERRAEEAARGFWASRRLVAHALGGLVRPQSRVSRAEGERRAPSASARRRGCCRAGRRRAPGASRGPPARSGGGARARSDVTAPRRAARRCMSTGAETPPGGAPAGPRTCRREASPWRAGERRRRASAGRVLRARSEAGALGLSPSSRAWILPRRRSLCGASFDRPSASR